jgi:phosphoribosylanthranilate isomerase
MELRVKICGITQPEQGRAIAQLGATALGFICVPATPRYVTPQQIRAIVDHLPPLMPDRIGVFVDATLEDIQQIVTIGNLSGVQLHGSESPHFCHQLRNLLPNVEIIKALRVQSLTSLEQIRQYENDVDTFLLDAFHPQHHGGTGQTLNWHQLRNFNPGRSWFLAGGLNPGNIVQALESVQPCGIDLSSGVERSPGDKDLVQVARLFEQLRSRHQL